MAKRILILVFIISVFFTFKSYSQEYKYNNKTITGVFKAEGKNKQELFSLIEKWISINYNSAKDVIQMKDKEQGIIIIKGVNKISYKNITADVFDRTKYTKDFFTAKFNNLIEINIKDNKYRISYKITDFAEKSIGYNNAFFNCISFDGKNKDSLNKYIAIITKLWKDSKIDKNKIDLIISLTEPMINDLNNNLKINIKSSMTSIYNSISSKEQDNW